MMMERKEILTQIKPYFDIEELVCEHVLAKFGKSAWDFLDTNFLHCLLIIRRDILKKPMWCNGNNAKQRGLRCNLCQLVKEKKVPYITAHLQGKAGDFTVQGMTAENARKLILQNADMLPCKIRLESGVNWLHFDVRDSGNEKVVFFKG